MIPPQFAGMPEVWHPIFRTLSKIPLFKTQSYLESLNTQKPGIYRIRGVFKELPSLMLDGVLIMSLRPKCVVTCTATLGNELLSYIKSPCIFRTLFFEIYSGWNTSLYAFDLRLIEKPVIFRVYSSILKHFQNILRYYLRYIKSSCIFRTLFFGIYSGWNTSLYAFGLRLIEKLIIFRGIFKYTNTFSKYIKVLFKVY